VAIATQAALAAAADPEPTFYICSVERTTGFGKVWYSIDVPVDERSLFHRISWQIPQRAEGLRLQVDWAGSAPVSGRLDDRARVGVHFLSKRPFRGDVRIEVRRTPGQHYPSEFAYAGPFRRLYRWPNSPLYYIDADGRWGDLNTWMSGHDALTFALVRRDGDVLAEDSLEASTLAGASAAIAAVQPEVEAMAADYRHKCKVPGPIFVTGAGH
jgi:hypothetical protein